MKKLYLILLFILIVIIGNAQKNHFHRQYLLNEYLLNPAIAGSRSYIPIRLSSRQQWAGFDDAPRTYSLSIHGRIKKTSGFGRRVRTTRTAMGGYVFTQKRGALSLSGAQVSFSHHLPIRYRHLLSLGVSFSAAQFAIDNTTLTPYEEGDPVFLDNIETYFVPDVDFGIYFYNVRNDNFYAGITVAQLFEFSIKYNDYSIESEDLDRQFYFLTGYKFDLNRSLSIEPSIMLRSNQTELINADINTRLYIDENLTLAVSYRTNDEVVGLFGVRFNKCYISYSYHYSMSSIMLYNDGTHEFVLGYNIGDDRWKSRHSRSKF